MTTNAFYSMLFRDRFASAFQARMLGLFAERRWETLGHVEFGSGGRAGALESLRSELSEVATCSAMMSISELAGRLVSAYGVASAVVPAGDADGDWRWVDDAVENLRLWLHSSLEIVADWPDDEVGDWRSAVPDVLAAAGRDIEDDPGAAASELVCCAALAVSLALFDRTDPRLRTSPGSLRPTLPGRR